MFWQPSRLDAVRTCMLLRCSRPSQGWQLSLGVQRRAGRSTRAFRLQHPRCELPDQAQPKSILDTVARPGVLRQTLVSRNTEQGIQAKSDSVRRRDFTHTLCWGSVSDQSRHRSLARKTLKSRDRRVGLLGRGLQPGHEAR
jgi:hypothetical protein